MNTFKSYQSTGVTTETTVYTGAVNTQATVIGMSVANTSANPVYVSVKLNSAYVIKDVPVVVGSTLVIVGGDQKVVVEAGDSIRVSSTGTVDVITSVLEIS